MFYCFFNDTSTTDIYTYSHTLSLHDSLPICRLVPAPQLDSGSIVPSFVAVRPINAFNEKPGPPTSPRLKSVGSARLPKRSSRLPSAVFASSCKTPFTSVLVISLPKRDRNVLSLSRDRKSTRLNSSH